jgi:hypothetical protein
VRGAPEGLVTRVAKVALEAAVDPEA